MAFVAGRLSAHWSLLNCGAGLVRAVHTRGGLRFGVDSSVQRRFVGQRSCTWLGRRSEMASEGAGGSVVELSVVKSAAPVPVVKAAEQGTMGFAACWRWSARR